MPFSKYTDFKEGDVVSKTSKMPPYSVDRYIPISCPHCDTVFVNIKVTDLKTNKASKCLNHLRICEIHKHGGGMVTSKYHIKVTTDEIAELKKQMAEMKEKMAESEHEKDEMKQEIKGLQDKTGLYDSVLEAVMPSLTLPLTAPVEDAKITLRKAAMKDVATQPLALMGPADLVSKEMHSAIIDLKDAVIDQKNEIIAIEKAHKAEFAKVYKDQLDAKDLELIKANAEKEKANTEKEKAVNDKHEMESYMRELNKRMDDASKTATSASSRADRLQKERDSLSAKYNASLKGHEQSVRNHGNHGKHGLSPLSRSKIGMRGCATDAEAEEARAMDRAYAQVEREREAQKKAQKEGPKRARLE